MLRQRQSFFKALYFNVRYKVKIQYKMIIQVHLKGDFTRKILCWHKDLNPRFMTSCLGITLPKGICISLCPYC